MEVARQNYRTSRNYRALASKIKIRFSLEEHHWLTKIWIRPMYEREPSTVESILSGNVSSALGPAALRNFLNSGRDDVLVVRESSHARTRNMLLVAVALAASFGLGWTGGLSWPQFAGEFDLETVAQNEAPSPRMAEARPSKIEAARKTTSATDSPAIVGSIPKPSLPRPSASAVSQANVIPSATIAMRQPALAAPPETRPTTIPGWTVVDVRDGTAVLEGPEGIKMAARGDAIPGLGRIESIVRWGNRWIVATANGLIATQ
ncbi:hypothetical protein [Bradyrhizobium sp. CB3481]|uniref:hypothetical protein n=1 Tax=Bradyrhizobium sp. CB3481 TaxID=3039158 RepID=UPI0024B26BC6|nr:hypothetical protein [Bradyrhizobium sp. CB3481]WFU17880.1 hypothetical protein QA643_05895 [Bradyrhizobium sp. CB3481]